MNVSKHINAAVFSAVVLVGLTGIKGGGCEGKESGKPEDEYSMKDPTERLCLRAMQRIAERLQSINTAPCNEAFFAQDQIEKIANEIDATCGVRLSDNAIMAKEDYQKRCVSPISGQ